jgi:hypothetical protein
METLFNQSTENFEILNQDEMDQLKGGFSPKEKDVFDPDEM